MLTPFDALSLSIAMAVLLPRLLQSLSTTHPRNSLESYLDLDTSSRATSPTSDASTPTTSYFFFVPDGMRLAHRPGSSYDAALDLPRGSSRIASDIVTVVPPGHSRSISPRVRNPDEHSHLRFPSEATERSTWATVDKPLPDAPLHPGPPRLNLTFSALSFGSFRIQSPTDGLQEEGPTASLHHLQHTTEQRHTSGVTHGSRQRTVTLGTASFLDFERDVDSSDAGTPRHRSATEPAEPAEEQQLGPAQAVQINEADEWPRAQWVLCSISPLCSG